jgi:hypothetical protein
VNVESKLANLTVFALFFINAFVNNAVLSANLTNVSLPITNGTYPPCGLLLPGDQNFTLALNVATGRHFSFIDWIGMHMQVPGGILYQAHFEYQCKYLIKIGIGLIINQALKN